MVGTQAIEASEFQAKRLDILDRLVSRELERVIITEQGRAMLHLAEGPLAGTSRNGSPTVQARRRRPRGVAAA